MSKFKTKYSSICRPIATYFSPEKILVILNNYTIVFHMVFHIAKIIPEEYDHRVLNANTNEIIMMWLTFTGNPSTKVMLNIKLHTTSNLKLAIAN